MKTRTGKIARLPRALRDQLNCRLHDGDSGQSLVDWLNALPEVRKCMAEHFAGRPITEQNLSEWKTGGFQQWLDERAALELATRMAENADELAAAVNGSLTDKMAILLAARYLVAIRRLDTTPDDEDATWKRLRALNRDVLALRRSEYQAGCLELEREKYDYERQSGANRAASANPTQSDLIKPSTTVGETPVAAPQPNPTQSDLIKPKELWPQAPKPPVPCASSQQPGDGGSSVIPPIIRIIPIIPIHPNQTQSNPIKPSTPSESTETSTTPVIAALPNPTQSDPIKPTGHLVPTLDPADVAYKTWNRMYCPAEPFDPERLAKLYAAIPID